MNHFKALEKHSSNTALILKDQSRVTYGELAVMADRFISRLPKERSLILIEMANELESIVAYFAALRGGHPAILVSHERPELTAQIKRSYKPDVIYEKVDGKFALSASKPQSGLHPDLGILLSTSGSTGSAKCVKLTLENLNANAESIAEYLNIDEKQKAITNLPLHYSYGLSILNSHIARGASIVVTDESVTHDSFWDIFKKEKVTSLAGVPYVYEMLDRRNFESMELPSLQYLTQAGGRLAPDLVKKFAQNSLKNNRRFYVMYGQTEATARISYMPWDKVIEYPHCMGVPIPRGEIKLFDGDKEVVESDQPGELVYTGPNVMMGYAYNREELAAGATLAELRTGDIACRNDEGLFYIVGRNSRFLKIFGQRLNLDEVELYLRRHSKEVVCSGTDHNLVALTTNMGESDTIKDLIVSHFPLSASVVTVIEEKEVPLLPSGKINYEKLVTVAREKEKENKVENSGNKTFAKRVIEKFVSFFVSTEPEPVKSVKDSFIESLGLQEVPEEESFVSLSGDSLSYVNLSIQLEQTLGYLPDNWENTSVRDLQALASQKKDSNNLREDASWNSINYFRAIAITMIVAGHCIYSSLWGINTFLEKVFFSLIKDGTILFVFISGYIFYHFASESFKYGRFIKNKIKSILAPYVLLSITMMFIRHYIDDSVIQSASLTGIALYQHYIQAGLAQLLTGGVLNPYWYIPFAMILFLMSPIHIRIVNMRPVAKTVLIGSMFAGGLILHRPQVVTSGIYALIQNLIYFTPVYLLGMISSKYKKQIYRKLKDKDIHLFLGVIAFAVIQVIVYSRYRNNAPFLVFNGFDFQLVQKIIMCYFFMIFLRKFERLKIPLLNMLATTSFAIYFLHFWFAYFVEYYFARHSEAIMPIIPPPLMWGIYIIVYTSASILVAMIIKKLFKSKSKYITGY